MSKIKMNLDETEVRAVMEVISAITGIPPIAPTNEQANLLEAFGCKMGSYLLYGVRVTRP